MNNKQIGIYEISKDILSRNIGDNIDTIMNYSERFNLSLGTIHKVLQILDKNNIVNLYKKGKYGTSIKNIEYLKLFEILGYKYLLCVMPITYSKIYKKIMDNINNSFNLPIPLYFAHMRGGYIRLKLLIENVYHFGIVSKLAAIEAISSGLNLEIIEEFGYRSYVTKHVILKRQDQDISIIGMDYDSNDHLFLTKFNFKNMKDIKMVDIKYSEVIDRLLDKTIDAAIWNYDDILDKMFTLKSNGIVVEDIAYNDSNLLATEAVIVINKDNDIVRRIFKKFFKKEKFKLI